MAPSCSKDILADFAHQLRQPLSTLETLAFYLDLIGKPENAQVHEQLRRMHAEIAHTEPSTSRWLVQTSCLFFKPGSLRARRRSTSRGAGAPIPIRALD